MRSSFFCVYAIIADEIIAQFVYHSIKKQDAIDLLKKRLGEIASRAGHLHVEAVAFSAYRPVPASPKTLLQAKASKDGKTREIIERDEFKTCEYKNSIYLPGCHLQELA